MPGSAECGAQRAPLSPLLFATGNSSLAWAREQCAASCPPCGRREARRARVPRAGTRGRAPGDRREEAPPPARQRAGVTRGPAAVMHPSRELAQQHGLCAWRGKRSVCAAPGPQLCCFSRRSSSLCSKPGPGWTLGTEAPTPGS